VGKVATQALMWRSYTRYVLEISDVSSFGVKSRTSENIGGDIRMPAEDRLSTEDGEFRSRTAESKQRLPQLF
jgi:hypothetical protein